MKNIFKKLLQKENSKLATDFPKIIGEYTFVKEIMKNKNPKPYSYAVYANKFGKKAFAKYITSKERKNYIALLNEIKAYQLLSEIYDYKEFKKESLSFKIPQFLGCSADSSHATLLIEYVTGEHLAYSSPDDKIQTYKGVFEFLGSINKPQLKSNLSLKMPVKWLFALLYFSVIATVKHPSFIWRVIRANVFVFRRFKLFLKPGVAFVHRDLGDWNIHVNKNKRIVYDLQLACISDPILDHAVTLSKISEDREFVKRLISEVYKKKLSNKDYNKLRALCICIVMYDVAFDTKEISRESLEFIETFLIGKRFKVMTMPKFMKIILRDLSLLMQSPKDYLFTYTYSNTETVSIEKFTPKSKEVALEFIQKVNRLAPGLKINIVGSTQYGIAGEKDIDLISPVPAAKIDTYVEKLSSVIGEPVKKRKTYSEWIVKFHGFKVEFNLMDPSLRSYKKKIIMTEILKKDDILREQYEKMKLDSNGVSLREYDKRKIEFFNSYFRQNLNI